MKQDKTLWCLALCMVATAAPPAAAVDGTWSVPGGELGGSAAGGRGVVRALLVHDERLVVGGLLARAGTMEIGNIAAWDGARWDSLGGGMDGAVDALIGFEGDLVAGGSFVRAGEAGATGIAHHDGERWHAFPAGPDGWVAALGVHEGRLVAGGRFFALGADSTMHVAAWDGERWTALGEGLGKPPGMAEQRRRGMTPVEVVYSLAAFHGDLIAGGVFGSSGERRLRNIARWDGAGWQDLGGGVDDEVRALAVFRGELIAGGKFRHAGGTVVNHIAAWNGESWRPLATRLALQPGLGHWVFALEPGDDTLLVGGCFAEIGEERAEFLATWDGRYWRSVATGLDRCVNAVSTWGEDVFLGGSFERAGLGRCRYLTRWER